MDRKELIAEACHISGLKPGFDPQTSFHKDPE